MREPYEIACVGPEYVDYDVVGSIGGAEYLSTPDDDLRWFVCFHDTHPVKHALPVVFFELLARRLAETDDIEDFIRGIRLPLPIRKHFNNAPAQLPEYLSRLVDIFPAIMSRAAWLSDEAGLDERFSPDMKKEDLKRVYSDKIKLASAKDVPMIGSALSKLEGWDAPEKHLIGHVTELGQILNDVAPALKAGDPYRPLPRDHDAELLPVGADF